MERNLDDDDDERRGYAFGYLKSEIAHCRGQVQVLQNDMNHLTMRIEHVERETETLKDVQVAMNIQLKVIETKQDHIIGRIKLGTNLAATVLAGVLASIVLAVLKLLQT